MAQEDDEHDAIVERAYKEYAYAGEVLAALEASCTNILTTSSITTEDGYWMYSPSSIRLENTDYVREQVAQYLSAKQHKEAVRKHLISLGEPDPE